MWEKRDTCNAVLYLLDEKLNELGILAVCTNLMIDKDLTVPALFFHLDQTFRSRSPLKEWIRRSLGIVYLFNLCLSVSTSVRPSHECFSSYLSH